MGKSDEFDNKRHMGAFLDTSVVEPTPIVQLKFPYNINTDFVTVTDVASGTTTQADSKAVVATGAATSSSSTMESNLFLIYQPGQGAVARFTAVMTQGVAGSTQEIGIGDGSDGFFVGYNGADFGVLQRQNGSDTWTTGDDLDGDVFKGGYTGTFDPTKGNIYQIQYQWLGFGNITFKVYDGHKGEYVTLHKIKYPNENTVPSIYNPSLPLRVQAANTTNNTNISVQTSSMAAFIEGKVNAAVIHKAVANEKSSVTTEVNILTIRSDATFQSKTNRGIVKITRISAAVDGTKISTIKVYKNTTLGGSPSYTQINANTSIVSYDTAGTTVTGGDLIAVFELAKEGSEIVSFVDENIVLIPGETLTVTATSAASTIADAAISWEERI
jgi:hypothetical protein